jgi:pimeloyl-ACP methyl ester carboxylesterase
MSEQNTVILVHGLWLHGVAMTLLGRRIARCGYRVLTYSYPSMRLTLTQNADRFAEYCRNECEGVTNFVGHSLGGLLVLRMVERAPQVKLGRVVLAGTPCCGSAAARRLARLPGGSAALGRSIPEWLGRDMPPRAPSCCDFGVIAGDLGLGLGRLLTRFGGPNDGVVSVDETRLPGVRDHVVLHVNHAGMLLSVAVAREACSFLRHGVFAHGEALST